MPAPRRYPSNAARQAAYRLRGAQTRAAALAAKDLPATSPVPSMPSYRRWRAMAGNGRVLFLALRDEMRKYADDRSEEWQESERAEEFADQLGLVEDVLSAIDEVEL